jgi:phosphate transport system permease protein
MPGVMTGAILSLAHALGETAPLLMIGMVSFVPGVPEGFTGAATVLPVQVFIWENAPSAPSTSAPPPPSSSCSSS